MEDPLEGFYPSSSSAPPALLLTPPSTPPMNRSATFDASSSSSNKYVQSMDINVRGMLHSLMAILESQEVALFSICADDVAPTVRSHLQSVKMANMKAKDIAGLLSNVDQLPITHLEIYSSSSNVPVVRVASMPAYSSNPYRRSAPSPATYAALQDSTVFSSAPSSPMFNRSAPIVLNNRKTPPPIISNLSLSAPSLPSVPPPVSSPEMPRTKSKMNFFRRYTESNKLKHTQSVELQPQKNKRGFSLFNTLKSPSSYSTSSTTPPASPTTPKLHLSLDESRMCKSLSLPSASAATYSPLPSPTSSPTMQTSPSLEAAFSSSSSAPSSPSTPASPKLQSAPSSPSSTSKKAVYPVLHEHSKLLYSRKLESMRASQSGDVY